jgi:two-component system response regulator LytT
MKIRILIIEDENPAQEHLVRLLRNIENDFIILERLSTVKASIAWLQNNNADIIFMDIQLSDGVSFKIFEAVDIYTPIIFTTAYDEYAIKAFKVNSVDYLLKPIDEDDLRSSIAKFKRMQKQNGKLDISQIIQALDSQQKTYQERFLVHRGERLLSVKTDQIAYFEGEDRYVYLYKKDGSKFIIDFRLSDLESLLDPKFWFRVNRSFICHIDAIKLIVNVSKSRVKLDLEPPAKREIIISSENSQAFKKWLNK